MNTKPSPRPTLLGWINTLSTPLREAVLGQSRLDVLEPGGVVYAAGSETRAVHGLLRGLLKMHIAVGEERMRFCHTVGPGYWFGELELLLPSPRMLEITAVEEAQILSVSLYHLDRVAEKHPEIWKGIARLAATNEALALAAADDLLLRDPRKRLAATLLRLSGRRWAFQEMPPLSSIPATQRELSEAANVSRTVISKLMSDFSRIGAVRTDYGQVRILRPELLRALL